jgi:hypothetical protein
VYKSEVEAETMAMPIGRQPRHDARPERRRSPRVELLSELHGQLVPFDVAVVIREASDGGFSMESPVLFPIGSEQMFRLRADSGAATTVRAVCRHSMRVNRLDGPSFSISGFEFLPQPEENLRLVCETIRAIV